jgi:transcriptional regulator with XRE-family HTH domain
MLTADSDTVRNLTNAGAEGLGRSRGGTRPPRWSGRKGLAMGEANLLGVDVDLEEMGRRLTQARHEAGMTVFELAIATTINESLLRRYLSGKTEPGAKRLARLAEVLQVSADWLIQNTDNPAPAPDVWKPGDPERRANPPTGGGAPLEAMDVLRKRPGRRRSA